MNIRLKDGTELIIKEMKDGVIDIMTTYSVSILPIASNHIQLKQIDVSIPTHTLKQLKKEGII